jgi:RHS repeat-associated protein
LRFTGQRQESGFGLYDYNARYYDPTIGRFVSADSIVPGAGKPQALNRYAYTLNNPLKYIDPSGHAQKEPDEDDSIPNPASHPDDDNVGTSPEGRGCGGNDGNASICDSGPAGGGGGVGLNIGQLLRGIGGFLRSQIPSQPQGSVFVGFHGTSSSQLYSFMTRGVNPLQPGQNFRGRYQLGPGFYVTKDPKVTLDMAVNAVRTQARMGKEPGEPMILKVYAKDFSQMKGVEIPSSKVLNLPAKDPLVTNFDYIRAPIQGYEPVIQIQFNPRAYSNLWVVPVRIGW